MAVAPGKSVGYATINLPKKRLNPTMDSNFTRPLSRLTSPMLNMVGPGAGDGSHDQSFLDAAYLNYKRRWTKLGLASSARGIWRSCLRSTLRTALSRESLDAFLRLLRRQNLCEHRSSLTEDDIMSVTFSSPKHGWAIGSKGTIVGSDDGGKTWGVVRKTTGDERSIELHAIHFMDDLHGAGRGFVDLSKDDKNSYLLTTITTSNGGRDWQKHDISVVDFIVNSMSIIKPEAGWAVGGAGQILRFRSE